MTSGDTGALQDNLLVVGTNGVGALYVCLNMCETGGAKCLVTVCKNVSNLKNSQHVIQ